MNIKLKSLSFNYNKKEILKDINLNFKGNTFYSILGPNGSGKTTLLKNILRLLEPKDNCVFIGDNDIRKLKVKDMAKKLSYVPQNTNLDYEFSVYDIVEMGRAPYKNRLFENSNDDEIIKSAMEVTNTWHLKDKSINSLSGGEQQRVLVARAIAQDTDIIILDEPISHLDIYHQIELLDTITILKKSKTIIAVLHDVNLAAQYSDYIILLNGGSIYAKGTPEEVINEKSIKDVYNLKVKMITDPLTHKPHIIPLKKQFNT